MAMREPPIPAATVRGPLPAPPATSDEPPPDGVIVIPTYKLFSTGQMALATFLGTPFAGCLLLGRNYGKLRQPRAAWIAYGIGAAFTALLLYAAIAVPEFPRIFSITGVVAIAVLGKTLQGDAFFQHERAGGLQASWWVAVGLSLLTTLCCVVLAVGTFLAYEFATIPPSIERNGGEVFHASGTTAAEATAVADLLAEIDYFSGDAASVRIQREGERIVALFVVQESAFNNDKVTTFFEDLQGKLSEKALGGKEVDIYLTDEHWARRETIPWESRSRVIQFGKDWITIRRGAEEAEGKRLGELLQRLSYFANKGHMVTLDRYARYRVSFIVTSEVTDQTDLDHYHRFAWRVSKHVVNEAPVDILLVDPDGKPVNRLSWDKRPGDPFVTDSGHEIHREGCSEDEARLTGEVLTSFLATRPGLEVWIDCDERVGVTINGKAQIDHRDVRVEDLSNQAFADRPVDLWIEATDGDGYDEYVWKDRPKTKRKK
jgi:hypothetical protein